MAVTNGYTSLALLKTALGINTADATRDSLLEGAINAASRAIDEATGRRFWLDGAASARVRLIRGNAICDDQGDVLLVDDVGASAGLVVEIGDGTSWTADTSWTTEPTTAPADGKPITSLRRPFGGTWFLTSRVRVTARWGWPSIPDAIAQACLMQSARLYRRKDSPEGVTGLADLGVIRVSRVDPDVEALIGPFSFPGFA